MMGGVMGDGMARKQKELGALAISNIKDRGIHFVGGVAGLAINVTNTGGRSWILRYQVDGKRRDMGLGGYPDVTLAQAKEKARAARALLAEGIDPIEHTRAKRSRLKADQSSAITFRQATYKYLEAHEDAWKSVKHAQQWRSTLETYAFPVVGPLLVRDVELPQVLEILEPIWKTKTETASRVRGRVESVLDWSIARGYRSEPNPARWKGLLDKLLPAPGKIMKREHHKALPYADLPDFMAKLRQQDGMGARALEFLILTGTRSGEVRGATWEEFDLNEGVWTVPAERMKMGKEHRVPLSDAALALILRQQEMKICEYVFPSPREKCLSDMTLTAVLRRMDVDAVPHGFRSSFRDWCAETTDYPREVAEMALAHAIGSKVEAAYRRGDLFGKRKELMQDWANYALSTQNTAI